MMRALRSREYNGAKYNINGLRTYLVAQNK